MPLTISIIVSSPNISQHDVNADQCCSPALVAIWAHADQCWSFAVVAMAIAEETHPAAVDQMMAFAKHLYDITDAGPVFSKTSGKEFWSPVGEPFLRFAHSVGHRAATAKSVAMMGLYSLTRLSKPCASITVCMFSVKAPPETKTFVHRRGDLAKSNHRCHQLRSKL
eukprot:SAG31_NODE_7680_length_1618_cov_5.397630_1_plen_167_part_00